MADAADYLNLSELRRLAEIGHDIAEYRARASTLCKEREVIKNRARKRLEIAQMKLRKATPDADRVVL